MEFVTHSLFCCTAFGTPGSFILHQHGVREKASQRFLLKKEASPGGLHVCRRIAGAAGVLKNCPESNKVPGGGVVYQSWLGVSSSEKLRKLCVRAGAGDDSEGSSADISWPHPLPPATDQVVQYLGINQDIESQSPIGYDSNEGIETGHDKSSQFQFRQPQIQEGYVGLFVRQLGLDHPKEDREAAVLTLWHHSRSGRKSIEEIIASPGCLNLVVSLLSSDREVTSKAAAGLLRNISAFEPYRSVVADAGALEEIAGLLIRRSVSSEVREQAVGVLWNLSANERERKKIAGLELLPVLLAMVDSKEELEQEAAMGVLANMSLSPSNHPILVDAGIIPKLVEILMEEMTVSKMTRKEARNILLALAKNPNYRLAIIENGLVPVPLIGASAYHSFKPLLEEAPPLPDNINLGEAPKSDFGAGELLLGLKAGADTPEIDDATRLTIEGRVKQQFLARIGVIEKEEKMQNAKAETVLCAQSEEDKITFMPWWDGIPRLVLILGLNDLTVACRAAESMAEIAINEEHRQAIHKAGGVPHLVRLLGCGDEATTDATVLALDMLGKSQKVRRSIDAHGAVPALVAILQARNVPQLTKERSFCVLMILVGIGMFFVREKIVAAGGIPPLIEVLASGTPSQAKKAVDVLENLAMEEKNAEAMVIAGVESALINLFDINLMEEDEENADLWATITSAAKLLERLVRVEKVARQLRCLQFASALVKILESPISPLDVKDWVCPCLLRLQSLTPKSMILDAPLDMEIAVHDTIPRLVQEITDTPIPEVQERAVLQLRNLLSHGLGAYSAAVSNTGGIFPLVNLLETGTTDARAAAIAVLYNLGMDSENHPAMLAAKIIPCLKRLVKTGAPEWKLALYLLRALPT
ncbi:unnamed protein product [Sphagnum compactum]